MSEQPKRIQRQRTKGWRMPKGAVYVGRPTKWGNPFTVKESTICDCCGQETGDGYTALDAVRDYRYFLSNPSNLHGCAMPTIEAIQNELRGKDLACWCRLDQPCHADVLLELANAESAKTLNQNEEVPQSSIPVDTAPPPPEPPR